MADYNEELVFKAYVEKKRQELRRATEQLRKYTPYVTISQEGYISYPRDYEKILQEYINLLRSFGIDIR